MSKTSTSTHPSQHSLLAYPSRFALPSLALGLLASACGGRYELGDVLQNLADTPVQDATQLGTLIVDGPEDADVQIEGNIGWNIGDVDGDGYADSTASSYGFSYGGPATEQWAVCPRAERDGRRRRGYALWRG